MSTSKRIRSAAKSAFTRRQISRRIIAAAVPIPMLLWCPACGARHIDRGEFADKEHHTHACQSCGMVWRPANCTTVGVDFLPGYKDGAP
jgi:predicted RNA-binding Zn-ribbon protein involved in translation (DUF1610 family)